jgi:hypothetical protein
MSEEKKVDFQLELLSMENEYFFKIGNFTYKLNLESDKCCKDLLNLANFDLQKFIDNCLEKIDDKNNGSTTFSTLKLTIQYKEVKIIPQYDITPEKIKEEVYNKLSISYNQEATELNGLSFFIIFLSIFLGMPLTKIELENIKSEFLLDKCLSKKASATVGMK